jgi:adenylate cyclase
VATFKKALPIYGPDTIVSHLMLARTYALMGWPEEAKAEGAEVLRIDPNFKISRYVNGSIVWDQTQKDHATKHLRMAGLK